MEIPNDLCRVCLDKGASLPIFETKDSVDPDIYSKLCQCLSEKIEDIDGYPRHICQLCHITLNTAIKFIEQYKSSAQILQLQSQSLLNNDEHEALDSDFLQLDENAPLSKLKLINVDEIPNNDLDHKILKSPLINNKNLTVKEEAPKKRTRNVRKPATIRSKNTRQKCKKKLDSDLSSDESLKKTGSTVLGISSDQQTTAAKERKNEESTGRKIRIKPSSKINSDNITEHICVECGKIFSDSTKLLYHKQKIHVGQLKCPHCPKMWGNEGSLKQHIKRAHLEKNINKKIICSYCGKLFLRKDHCVEHEKSVHEGIRKPRMTKRFICNNCNESFWNGAALQCHMRRVHTGERPEICSVCGKDFTHVQYLTAHMLLHTGEKPYKCPICFKGHTNKANVKSHIRHNHRLSDLDEKTIEELSKCKINYLKHLKP